MLNKKKKIFYYLYINGYWPLGVDYFIIPRYDAKQLKYILKSLPSQSNIHYRYLLIF